MDVRFYNFSKRSLETKKPTGNGTKITCHLKDATSIESPTLILQTIDDFSFNYAYIQKWGRYYFVNPPVSVDGMWEVSLVEDLLASFKSEIGSTTANILYAGGSTKNIADTRIPVTADLVIEHDNALISGFSIMDQGGHTVIGITGKKCFGAYVCDQVDDLLDGVDGFWNDLNIANAWDALKQFFTAGDAGSCLKSAIKLPIDFTLSTVGPSELLWLGSYQCKDDNGNQLRGYHVIYPIITGDATISIPWPNDPEEWLKLSQYTEIILYLPFIGMISLPASELQGSTSLVITYKINVTSGDIAVSYADGTNGKIYGTASGNIAQNTAYGSTGIDTNKATQSVVTGIGTMVAAAAATYVTGGLSAAGQIAVGTGLANSATQALIAMGSSASGGSGGLGGGAANGLNKNVNIWVVRKQLSDRQANFAPLIGKPYMGVATVSSFSGFIQTDGFQLSANNIYASERDRINQMLDQGIYYT